MLLSVIVLHFLSCQESCCYAVLPLALLWDVHLCFSQHGWSTHFCLMVWGKFSVNLRLIMLTQAQQESKADKLL